MRVASQWGLRPHCKQKNPGPLYLITHALFQTRRAGFDKYGFNKDGFDKNGYNVIAMDKSGFDAAGYNILGFDKDGFNKEGFNKDGYNRRVTHPDSGLNPSSSAHPNCKQSRQAKIQLLLAGLQLGGSSQAEQSPAVHLAVDPKHSLWCLLCAGKGLTGLDSHRKGLTRTVLTVLVTPRMDMTRTALVSSAAAASHGDAGS